MEISAMGEIKPDDLVETAWVGMGDQGRAFKGGALGVCDLYDK